LENEREISRVLYEALKNTPSPFAFGAIKQSGIAAYHGKHSFDVFTHKKAIVKTAAWFDPLLNIRH
jgi:hypothetical protein